MNKDIFLKISIIIACAYPFFGYLLGANTIILASILILLILNYLIQKEFSVYIQNDTKLWLVCTLLVLISALYSIDQDRSIKYFINFFIIIVFKILLENKYNWNELCEKSIIVFSSVHIVATLMYLVSPNFIQSICLKVLPYDDYVFNVKVMQLGSNPGITIEPGFNAFVITMFIAIFFGKYLCCKKNKAINILLLSVGVFCLFLTGKRGLLLGNIVAMVTLIFIFAKDDKRKIIKYIFSFILIVIISYIIITNIPAANVIIERFNRYKDAGDITNGRSDLYKIMWENIKENTLLGSGIRSTVKLLGGNDGHNIYIQLFSELGIVGLSVFLYSFAISLIRSIKIEKIMLKNQNINLENRKKIIAQNIYIQIFFLAYGMTGNPLYNTSIFIFYIIMTASINSFYRIKEDRKQDELIIKKNSKFMRRNINESRNYYIS